MATLLQSPSGAAYSSNVTAGLTLLRVVIGVIMTAHGWQKLFVYGLPGVTQLFTQMGAPLPEVTAPLIAVLEFFGGIALILGLLTRLVAAGFAIDMLGAILIVHLKAGFFVPNGVELVLALFAGAATLALTGPGVYSLDHMIAGRRGDRGSAN